MSTFLDNLDGLQVLLVAAGLFFLLLSIVARVETKWVGLSLGEVQRITLAVIGVILVLAAFSIRYPFIIPDEDVREMVQAATKDPNISKAQRAFVVYGINQLNAEAVEQIRFFREEFPVAVALEKTKEYIEDTVESIGNGMHPVVFASTVKCWAEIDSVADRKEAIQLLGGVFAVPFKGSLYERIILDGEEEIVLDLLQRNLDAERGRWNALLTEGEFCGNDRNTE